jgi:LPS-assembly lipoprotein
MWRAGSLTLSSNRKFLPLLGLLALAGCGFTPLYGGDDGAEVQGQLEQVKIANIPERPGQLLHEALEAQMQRQGSPTQQLYVLNVNYVITPDAVGVQADSSVSRVRYNATAQWILNPIGAPTQKLASGQAVTSDALNVIDQQYFAQSLEASTVNRQLADQIAAQIAQQVAVYFRTHPAAPAPG